MVVLVAAWLEHLPINDAAALGLIQELLVLVGRYLDALLIHTDSHQLLVLIIGSKKDHIQNRGLGIMETGLSALLVRKEQVAHVAEGMGVLTRRAKHPLKVRQLEHRQAY